jgi:uncharacterized protein YdhG (YjbR/CyaY superfamily)
VKPPLTPTEQYLLALPAAQRRALAALRATILEVEPRLQERLSSGAPFFWFNGRRAVGLGAAKTHLSFYIMHGQVLAQHRQALEGHDLSRTVVRFTPERPLPPALIERLVRARVAEIAGWPAHRDDPLSRTTP